MNKENNMIKSRKGDLMSIWWWVIMGVSGIFIIMCVLVINGSPIDVRKAEAEILANRIIDCLVVNGKLVDMPQNINIEEFCGFNFNEFIDGKVEKSQYYVQLKIKDLDGKEIKNIETFDSSYIKDSCELQKKTKLQKKLPRCVEKEIYSLMKDGKEVKILIFTGVNKGGKNAK